jgi:LacI family transcriptional regulator
MFCQSNETYEREVKAVQTLLSSRVDGILVSITKVTKDFGHFRKIQDNGIPLVFFDRICNELDTDRVIVDDEQGAFDAVEHLIKTGCKNIVHLSGPQNLQIGKNRKDGYLRALRYYNQITDEQNIIKCDTREEATIIVPELMKRTNRPDGIFAVNDLTAVESMNMIKECGFNVPKDVSVVGFTNGMISDITCPTLSSVEQHGYMIGKEAVKLLINRIEKKQNLPFRTITIKTEMVIKGSSRNVG